MVHQQCTCKLKATASHSSTFITDHANEWQNWQCKSKSSEECRYQLCLQIIDVSSNSKQQCIAYHMHIAHSSTRSMQENDLHGNFSVRMLATMIKRKNFAQTLDIASDQLPPLWNVNCTHNNKEHATNWHNVVLFEILYGGNVHKLGILTIVNQARVWEHPVTTPGTLVDHGHYGKRVRATSPGQGHICVWRRQTARHDRSSTLMNDQLKRW